MMSTRKTVSDAALALIIKFEVGGGKNYYDRFLSRPSWPGYASGVTVGIGSDLGYDSSILPYLDKVLSADQMRRLKATVGVKGTRAGSLIKGLRDISIPWETALTFFLAVTIPKYIKLTLQAFPGADELPDDAFGALVSLVFNRGALVNNTDRRKEMLQIRNILAEAKGCISNDTIKRIAAQVNSMKRLWPDNRKSNNDLHDRREQEAQLILSTIV